MKTSRHLMWVLAIAAAGVCSADPLTNLVTNGGFETGSFSGWTVSGNITPCLFVGTSNDARCIPTSGYGANTGSYAAELGNAGADAYLSQNLATTSGAPYELTFWLASQAYGTPQNDFSVSWGGQQLYSQVNLGAFGYTEFDFTGLVASSSTTTLTFAFANTPSYFVLDDVSVVDPPPAVPEPGTLVLLVPALAVLAIRRRGSGRLAAALVGNHATNLPDRRRPSEV